MRLLRLSIGLVCIASSSAVAEGPFVGQFELKNLESDRGFLEFQSQNAYTFGQPRRGVAEIDADDGEFLYDENEVARQRHALELEMGAGRFLKGRIGIEFEKERFDEPASPSQANDFDTLKLTEIGGEVIAILVPRDGDGFGLGAVVEVERPILSAQGEPSTIVMGPIIEWAGGPWSVSLVPMAVHLFGGEPEMDEDGIQERLDHKWDFAYAAQAAYVYSDSWTFAVEAYGTIDRLGQSGRPSEANLTFGDLDQHRLGPIAYYSMPLDQAAAPQTSDDDPATLTVGLGLFAGLNENTPDGTLKLSVEVDY